MEEEEEEQLVAKGGGDKIFCSGSADGTKDNEVKSAMADRRLSHTEVRVNS